MHKVLFIRLFRRNAAMLSIFAGGIFGFEFLLVAIYPTLMGNSSLGIMDLGELLEMMPDTMKSFFGGRGLALTGLQGWLNFAFMHPIIIFLLSAFLLSVAARSVAGEVGSGTSELLFARPVLRRTVVLTNAVYMIMTQCCLSLCAFGAIVLGHALFGIEEALPTAALAGAALNAAVITLAFGFFTLAVSSLTNSQERALAFGGGITFFLYIWNVITDLWNKINGLKKFGLFHYYEPGRILAGQAEPYRDFLVAGLVGLVSLAVALWVVEKRDL